ncbi:putative serine racemase [Iris pallida]|uniref:Serine racemase n=1 Tax=Iris pallida TaxID=29817 RepID=A0AAX6HI80_IRIPA|nr:putative serine racemase [Iris pallida]
MESKAQVQSQNYAADIETIKEAQLRIGPYIHKTPVLSSTTLDGLAGKRLYFKCECFQKGGAFKFRGASNAIFSLTDEEAAKGVVTHSSGNHAAAVSLAAKLRGIPAYIVVPKNAPKCKVENVKRYGGQVIWSETTMLSRESTASKVQQETGAVLIHPFNDTRIISGQGTISLELMEQVPEIDTIIVPISGGGLISGVTLAAKAINPAIRVLAAEPRGADDAAQSKTAGRIITLPQTNTIADGLRASLGDLTCMSYYVVLKGRKQGVYTTWADCYMQVNGYKGACYFKCHDYEEARGYFQSNDRDRRTGPKGEDVVNGHPTAIIAMLGFLTLLVSLLVWTYIM